MSGAILPTIEPIAAIVRQVGEQCLRIPPEQYQAYMQELRGHLVRAIIELPDDHLNLLVRTPLSGWQTQLRMGALTFPTDPVERRIAERARAAFANGWGAEGAERAFAIARLYYWACELPIARDIERLDELLLRSYMHFLFAHAFYVGDDDADKQVAHHENLLEFIGDFLEQDHSAVSRYILMQTFTDGLDSLLPSFTHANTQTLMARKQRVVQHLRSYFGWTSPPDLAHPPARRRLRFGIVMKTIMAGGESLCGFAMIHGLPRDRYEVIVFTYDHTAGYYHDINFYRRFYPAADEIVRLPTNAADIIETLHKYDLDVLLLATTGGAVGSVRTDAGFSVRLARCQIGCVSTIGGTTGNPHFDYALGIDPPPGTIIDPSEFNETLVPLPGPFIHLPESWPQKSERYLNRAELDIPEGAPVFISGATLLKIIPPLSRLWLRLLARVPNSVLILYPFAKAWFIGEDQEQLLMVRLQQQAAEEGVDLSRLRILKGLDPGDIYNLMRLADVFLGSHPFGGITTMGDALRAGCPPVIMKGRWQREYANANWLHVLGLDEYVVTDDESYLALAARLAQEAQDTPARRERLAHIWAAHGEEALSRFSRTSAQTLDAIVRYHFANFGAPRPAILTFDALKAAA